MTGTWWSIAPPAPSKTERSGMIAQSVGGSKRPADKSDAYRITKRGPLSDRVVDRHEARAHGRGLVAELGARRLLGIGDLFRLPFDIYRTEKFGYLVAWCRLRELDIRPFRRKNGGRLGLKQRVDTCARRREQCEHEERGETGHHTLRGGSKLDL
jgi:hypothetical protein